VASSSPKKPPSGQLGSTSETVAALPSELVAPSSTVPVERSDPEPEAATSSTSRCMLAPFGAVRVTFTVPSQVRCHLSMTANP
jgi:hypothetical protein